MAPQNELERLYCITTGEQGNIETYHMDTRQGADGSPRYRIHKPTANKGYKPWAASGEVEPSEGGK